MKIVKATLLVVVALFILGLIIAFSPFILFFGSIGWYLFNKDKDVMIGGKPISLGQKRMLLGCGIVASWMLLGFISTAVKDAHDSREVAKRDLQNANQQPKNQTEPTSNHGVAASQTPHQPLPEDKGADDVPSRDELIRGVYLSAAGTALQAKIGEDRATPEEFIEMTHQAAKLLGADRPNNSHAAFLLNLKPDKDVSKEIEGNSVRALHYGKEMAVFVRNKKTGKMEFISATINGSPKMNTNR